MQQLVYIVDRQGDTNKIPPLNEHGLFFAQLDPLAVDCCGIVGIQSLSLRPNRAESFYCITQEHEIF